ncbi:MAG TPA: alkaline phosphatase [Ignavibacteriaceae bacterium]|nr:alkaline phosphatase [Ignavibacteriaceae bacterium]
MKLRLLILLFLLLNNFSLIGQNFPKNIIFLIGDGMGVNYIAASFFDDENNPYRNFKSIGLVNIASLDRLITDSGAAATVLATGHRTVNRYISVDSAGNKLKTLFQFAKEKGKSVGLVSTSSVTHATPAAFYAHTDDRGRETDIAFQLAQSDVDVIIGGGTQFFLPDIIGGSRKDDINVIQKMENKSYKGLNIFDYKAVVDADKVLCLMEKNGLKSASERINTLGDFTKAAIYNLNSNENGFVLMVEGSQIDWAGHENNQDYLLSEMRDFNTAITEAFNFAQEDGNTLIVITADHETGGMAITGGDLDGENLKLGFLNKSHTAGFVPVLSFGPFEEKFRGILENYEIGQNLILLINPTHQF